MSRSSRPLHPVQLRADTLLLLLGLLVLVLRVLWATADVLPIDDAFISFRYARNLADGHGLVFNPGERVEGYTNFLWTVLLAGGIRAGLDPVLFSRLLATLAVGGTMVLLLRLGRRVLGPLAVGAAEEGTGAGWLPGLPPLLFAAMGSQARLVATGMETLLFTLLVFATGCSAHLATLSGSRSLRAGPAGSAAAGALAALAAMTRPEGLLYGGLAGLYLAYAALRRRPAAGPEPRPARLRTRLRAPALFGLSFVALYGPYFLWRLDYYGHLLPNTFYAKVGVPRAVRLEAGWECLLEIGGAWGVLPLLVLAVAAALPTKGAILPGAAPGPFRVFAFAVVLATAGSFVLVGGDFLPFFGPRFLVPALPFLLVLATMGLRRASALLPGRRTARAAAATAALLLGAYCVWLTWPAAFWRFPGLDHDHRAWRAAGLWISERAGDGATLATSAVGIMPYVTDLPTIDLFGLTDEHIAHHGRLHPAAEPGHQKTAPGYVLDRRPDVLAVPRLNAEGVPVTAGLGWVADRIARDYGLVAQVRTRKGPPRDGRWVVEVDGFRPDLYHRGYRMGIFWRRGGDRAR